MALTRLYPYSEEVVWHSIIKNTINMKPFIPRCSMHRIFLKVGLFSIQSVVSWSCSDVILILEVILRIRMEMLGLELLLLLGCWWILLIHVCLSLSILGLKIMRLEI